MHLERVLWIFLSAVALIFLWGSADKHRKARVGPDERVEFAPNRRAFWAWPVMVAYLIWTIAIQVKYSHGRPFELMIAVSLGVIAVMMIFTFPGTIIVTADGLEQTFWLWKNKRIRWAEIAEINTGEKSRTVTITGADGTKIVHSRQLPDRPELLIALKSYCGENLPSDFPREPDAGL